MVSIALATFTMASCEDQPDAFKGEKGEPTIKYIRPSLPQQADSLISGAELESIICIVGENLKSVHEIWFNDQKAALNTSYMTDNTIIVAIPSTIPAEVSNKIYFKTFGGSIVEYDFNIVVPKPIIYSISNENARPGQEVTIYGNYFCDDVNIPVTVELPGGIIVSEFTNIAINRLSFILPNEATTEGQLAVTSVYGTGKSPFYINDHRGMLFDFDSDNSLSFKGDAWKKHSAIIDDWSLSGGYVQMGNGSQIFSESGTWIDDDEVGYFLLYWPGTWGDGYPKTGMGAKIHDLIDMTDWENMSLKFEMLIPTDTPWSSGVPMQIIFSSESQVSVTAGSWDYFNGAADLQSPRALYRPWRSAEGGVYHTDNEWTTVTIPLNTVVYNYEETATSNPITGPESFAGLSIIVCGGSVEGEQTAPVIKIDNIRIVKNL